MRNHFSNFLFELFGLAGGNNEGREFIYILVREITCIFDSFFLLTYYYLKN